MSDMSIFLGRMAQLEAMVASFESRMRYLEDDFPTARNGIGGGEQTYWSGRLWYAGELRYDFSKTDANPDGSDIEGGLISAVSGKYLKVRLRDCDWSFVDDMEDDVDEYSYFQVATKAITGTGASVYSLSAHTCGDIRIEYVPYTPLPLPDE